MATQNEVLIRIKADDDASAVIKKLQAQLNGLGNAGGAAAPKLGKKGIGGAISNLTGNIGGLISAAGPKGAAIGAIVVGAGKLGPAMFNAAKQVQDLKSQLKAVQGTSEATEKRFQELATISKEITGLDLNSLIKYSNVLETVGVSAEDADTVLKGFAAGASEAGLSAARTNSVMEQLSQAFAANVIQAGDMRTVYREMPAVQNAAKELFGETAGTVEGLRGQLELLGIEARSGLTELFERVEEVAEIDMSRFSTQWEMLQETMNQWLAGGGSGLVEIGAKIVAWINEGTEAVENWFKASFSGNENWHTLVKIFEMLGPLWNTLGSIFKGLVEILLTINLPFQILKNFEGIMGTLIDAVIATGKAFGAQWAKDLEEYRRHTKRMIEVKADEAEQIKIEAEKEAENQKVINASMLETRQAYLKSVKDEDSLSFQERRDLANAYFDKQIENINNLELKEDESQKKIAGFNEQRKKRLETINTAETEQRKTTLQTQLADLKTHLNDVERDEGSSFEARKTARTAVYEKEKELLGLTVTETGKQKLALTNLEDKYKDDIAKIDGEITTENQKEIDARNQASSDAKDLQIRNFDAIAEGAKEDYESMKIDGKASYDDLNKKANEVMLAEIAAVEAKWKAGKLTAEEATTEIKGIQNEYKKTVKANEEEMTKATKEAREAEVKASQEAKKERTKESDDAKKAEVSNLVEIAKQAGIEYQAMANSGTEDYQTLKNKAIEVMNAEIEAVNAKVAAGILTEEQGKTQRLKIKEDTKTAINKSEADISQKNADEKDARIQVSEDEKNERIKKADDARANAERNYDRVTGFAESSATDINKAAQELYEAELEWIKANVDDNEKANQLILQSQRNLDKNRITSVELFYKKNAEYIQAGLDLAIDAARREIDIRNQVANAERDIQQDKLKAEIDFNAERAAVIAKYEEQMGEARRIGQERIDEARAGGATQTEINAMVADLDRRIGQTVGGQLIGGFENSLVKQRDAELQKITDTLNDANRDYFAGLREIQNEARKDRAKGFWDTIGSIADFGLTKAGEGIGAMFGSPQIGKFLGSAAGDLATLGTTHLGNVAVNDIQDQFLREQLQIYQTQRTREAQNRSRGVDDSQLRELFKGGEFDPDVIEERRLEAEAKIQERLSELRRQEILELGRNVDSKRRYFEDALDDEQKTIDTVKERYEAYHARRKALLELTVLDEHEKRDEMIRLTWEYNDDIESIEDLFEQRKEKKEKDKEKKEEDKNKKKEKSKVESLEKETEALETSLDKQVELTKNHEGEIVRLLDEISTLKQYQGQQSTKVVKESLDEETEAYQTSGIDITHIIQAINATKESLADSELVKTTEVLDAEVSKTASAGLNITHIVAALNKQKESLMDSELEKTTEVLDAEVSKTKTAGLDITDIVGALNAYKKKMTEESSEKEIESIGNINEQYQGYYENLKEQDTAWNLWRNQAEGFHGVLVKGRLDKTLDDYRNHYADLKEAARDAYEYIEGQASRSTPVSRRTAARNTRTSTALFDYPQTDAMAYQGGQATAAKVKNARDFTDFFSSGFLNKIDSSRGQSKGKQTLILDFGDGVMKEVQARTEQIENDRRGYVR